MTAIQKTGIDERNDQRPEPEHARCVVDVVVIGGGAAGLSAALTLARARRSVLVVDAGRPRNARAEGVHGFLTRDGIPPLELLRLGRTEVESYGGEVVTGEATSVTAAPPAERTLFTVTIAPKREGNAGGTIEVDARRLIVATGLTDELPAVPGLADRWGRDVVHCPYCHGWEIRNRAIGVLGTSSLSAHQAQLFRQWSSDVTLFLDDAVELTSEQREELAARDIGIVSERVTGLRIDADRLTGVRLVSGRTVSVEALAAGAPVHSNSELLESLGILAEEHPAGFGTTVPNDPATGATTVPGVWVAGNVGEMAMQVVSAAASGVKVAAMVNLHLIAEETAVAVAARRDMREATASAPDPAAALAGADR